MLFSLPIHHLLDESGTFSYKLVKYHDLLAYVNSRTGRKANVSYVRSWLHVKSLIVYARGNRIVPYADNVQFAARTYTPYVRLEGVYHVVSRLAAGYGKAGRDLLHELHAHLTKGVRFLPGLRSDLRYLMQASRISAPTLRYRAQNVREYFDLPELVEPLSHAQIAAFAMLGKDNDPLKDELIRVTLRAEASGDLAAAEFVASDDLAATEIAAAPPSLMDSDIVMDVGDALPDLSWLD